VADGKQISQSNPIFESNHSIPPYHSWRYKLQQRASRFWAKKERIVVESIELYTAIEVYRKLENPRRFKVQKLMSILPFLWPYMPLPSECAGNANFFSLSTAVFLCVGCANVFYKTFTILQNTTVNFNDLLVDTQKQQMHKISGEQQSFFLMNYVS
jgi:hypothetical protein